ncbi:hypothetical protein FF38_11320 [Lucilia cuprina]|uniref:Uncharacterized protein n=1 Tax=Lucilia cuprina TaxID=7375 RepID=A0A0L0BVI5_LUCCU|nr:hypothetical protein CVS40_7486 [Lucilia cuprina]KNC24052.1 hypothetical protein FF38_11320 [Lucilia cuprina]
MPGIHCQDKLNKLLKLSMVPVPCQECQLNADGCLRSESIEWLWDLKDKIPIWSRLNEINTCGFKRKLPMSMTKNFDIEIKNRLWSLWSRKRKHKVKNRKSKSSNKSYMAASVIALCTAKVIRLNIWNSQLMDCIYENGRKFYKESLKKSLCSSSEFQLENLNTNCSMEGIQFHVCLKTVQQGRLYSIPLKCQPNLAYALIQFFSSYQYGLLECNNRILSLGFIDGPSGGYFMYDAQSKDNPLFPKDISGTYLLRTNHLQVLLYCLIISLNVSYINAPFCLHHLKINVIQPQLPKLERDPSKRSLLKCKRILPTEFWKTPSIPTLKSVSSQTNSKVNTIKCATADTTELIESNRIYRRKFHNISKHEEENGLIKSLVDADRQSSENLKIKNDFVRMICSATKVNLTPAEENQSKKKDFVYNLLDILVLGPDACLKLNDI